MMINDRNNLAAQANGLARRQFIAKVAIALASNDEPTEAWADQDEISRTAIIHQETVFKRADSASMSLTDTSSLIRSSTEWSHEVFGAGANRRKLVVKREVGSRFWWVYHGRHIELLPTNESCKLGERDAGPGRLLDCEVRTRGTRRRNQNRI